MPKKLKPRTLYYEGLSIVIISSLFAAGCDRVQSAPRLILADGQTYLACKDSVWVDSETILGGGTTFKISFTDANGLGHVLRGIKKLEVSDMPKLVDAPMPSNPGMLTSDGSPVVEGQSYTWGDGTQARFHNGKWEAVQIPNNACQSEFGGSRALQQGHPTTAAADEPSGTEKSSPACLSYEPAVVRLRGTITPKTFPGRPNYESVEKGDEPENEWILNADMPLCTNKDSSDPNNLSEANIRELELVFMGQQGYDTYGPMLGKTVDVTGSLFHAYTAHHHTTILLQVKDMEPR